MRSFVCQVYAQQSDFCEVFAGKSNAGLWEPESLVLKIKDLEGRDELEKMPYAAPKSFRPR